MHAHGPFDGARLRRQAAREDGVVRVVGKAGRQGAAAGDLRQLRRIARQRTGHQPESRQDHPAEENAIGREGVDGGGGAAIGDDDGLARRQRVRADGGGKTVAAQLGRLAVGVAHAGQMRQRGKRGDGLRRQIGRQLCAQARADGRAGHVRQQHAGNGQAAPGSLQGIELRMRHGAAGQPGAGCRGRCGQGPFDARVAGVDQQEHALTPGPGAGKRRRTGWSAGRPRRATAAAPVRPRRPPPLAAAAGRCRGFSRAGPARRAAYSSAP